MRETKGIDMEREAPDGYGEWLDDGGLEVINTIGITEEEEMKAFDTWLVKHPVKKTVFKGKFRYVDNIIVALEGK
jgi:hypothetical protein